MQRAQDKAIRTSDLGEGTPNVKDPKMMASSGLAEVMLSLLLLYTAPCPGVDSPDGNIVAHVSTVAPLAVRDRTFSFVETANNVEQTACCILHIMK